MLNLNLTLLIQMTSFLLFAWLFNQLFFKPLVAHLQARNSYVDAQQTAADLVVSEARQLRQEHDRRLREAQLEAQAAVDLALKEARDRKGERLAKAHAEAQMIVAKVRTQLEQERSHALGQLRAEVDGMATQIADKILPLRKQEERHREGAEA